MPTTPVRRIIASDSCAFSDLVGAARRNALDRLRLDASSLMDFNNVRLELSRRPQRHLVQSTLLFLVSREFVAAAQAAGATLDFAAPVFHVAGDLVHNYVLPILHPQPAWLDRDHSEVLPNGSVEIDVWNTPPFEALFLREPITRILNVTNGVYQSLRRNRLIGPPDEIMVCR